MSDRLTPRRMALIWGAASQGFVLEHFGVIPTWVMLTLAVGAFSAESWTYWTRHLGDDGDD